MSKISTPAAVWRKRIGRRVLWLDSQGERATGRLVRVEGDPPDYVWVDWDSPLAKHRQQRILWPNANLIFDDEVSDAD